MHLINGCVHQMLTRARTWFDTVGSSTPSGAYRSATTSGLPVCRARHCNSRQQHRDGRLRDHPASGNPRSPQGTCPHTVMPMQRMQFSVMLSVMHLICGCELPVLQPLLRLVVSNTEDSGCVPGIVGTLWSVQASFEPCM